MKVGIETFVTVIFLTITVLIATQIIGSQMQISTAKEFHSNAVQVIEESNFNGAVIEECKVAAEELGYVLDIVVKKESKLKCATCNTQWEIGGGTCCPTCSGTNIITDYVYHDGTVNMNYTVSVPLLGVEKDGIIEAYAR